MNKFALSALNVVSEIILGGKIKCRTIVHVLVTAVYWDALTTCIISVPAIIEFEGANGH